MALKLPERDDYDDDGPKVADLVDKLVLIVIKEFGDPVETQHGVKPFVKGFVSEIDLDASTVTELGETTFFQQVLVEKFLKCELDDKVVGRIIQPRNAYLLERPEADEVEAIEKLLDEKVEQDAPDDLEPF